MATHSIIVQVDTADPTLVGQLQMYLEQYAVAGDNGEDAEPLPQALAEAISGFQIVEGDAFPDNAIDYNDGVNQFHPKG